jgi:hypothetical protein
VSATWTAWRTAAVDASGSVCGSTTPVPTRAAGGHAGRAPTKLTAHGRPWPAAAAVPVPCPAMRIRVGTSAGLPQAPTSVHSGGRRAGGGRTSVRAEPSPRTSFLATDSSLVTCAGHHPSGQWSFRTQRTVNPPTGRTRYNFLYASSWPACGRPPGRPSSRRQRRDRSPGADLTLQAPRPTAEKAEPGRCVRLSPIRVGDLVPATSWSRAEATARPGLAASSGRPLPAALSTGHPGPAPRAAGR